MMTKIKISVFSLVFIFQCFSTSLNLFADTTPSSNTPASQLSITINGVQNLGAYSKDITPQVKTSGEAAITGMLNQKPYNYETITSEGEYLLEITATGQSGIRTVKSVSFTIDKTAPVTSAVSLGVEHAAKMLYLSNSNSITLNSAESGTANSGVERIEYRFTKSSEWKQYSTPVEIDLLPQGQHDIFFRSIDRAGNIETDKSLPFYLDSQKPESRLEIGEPFHKNTNGNYTTGSTLFKISATDDGSGVEQSEYRIDSGPWTTYLEPFRIDAEGSHDVQIRSRDKAGNVEAPLTKVVINDSSPPISIISPEGKELDSEGNLQINAPVKITLSAIDRHSGVRSTEYRIGNGNWLPYEPFTIDARKNQEIQYRSTDNLGNQEIIKSVSVKIDNTPPVTEIKAPSIGTLGANNIITVRDTSFFALSATDNQSGVALSEYRVDDGEWIPYEPFTVQEGGKHTIQFRSTDKAGNTGKPGVLTVFVDTFPPVSHITVNDNAVESGGSLSSASAVKVAISAKDANSGIKKIEYKLDERKWGAYEPFTISEEGSHLLEFRATDQLENVEPTRFIKVIIDRTPPVSTLRTGDKSIEENGQLQITDSTAIAISAYDQLSGVASSEYLISGKGERHGSEPFSISTAGEYEIRYWSVDTLGNREQDKITRVKVTLPPPPEIIIDSSKGDGDKKNNSATYQRPLDPDIPESIRLQPEQVSSATKLEPAPEKITPQTPGPLATEDESVYLKGFISGKESEALRSNAMYSKDHTKEYLGIGGINAIIIALIFLVL